MHKKLRVEGQLGVGSTGGEEGWSWSPCPPGCWGTPHVSKQRVTSGKSDLAVVSVIEEEY